MGRPNFINRHIELSLTTEEFESLLSESTKNRVATLVAPFDIKLGAVKNTNYGETQEVNPANQTTFQQVFTGQDAILVEWQDSTTMQIAGEGADHFIPKYKVGREIKGYMSQETSLTSFAKKLNPSIANFTMQQTKISASIIYENKEFGFNDSFKFFIIPQTGSKQFYYAETTITYNELSENPRQLQEVIYSSVNDLLEETGSSVENYIQLCAPGERQYAFPIIKYREVTYTNEEGEELPAQEGTTKWEPYFDLDIATTELLPVTNIQIEAFGGVGLGGVIIMGRPMGNTTEHIIEAPRFIMGSKFLTPIGSQITKATSGENNYKMVFNAHVEVEETYDSWKTKVQGQYDNDSKPRFEGNVITDKDKTDKTNNRQGTYFNLWNDEWNSGLTTEEMGGSYDSRENRWTTDEVTFKTNTPAIEAWNTMGILAMSQQKVPLSLKESVVWSLKEFGIIGGVAQGCILGYPVGWQNNKTIIAGKPINFFVPATWYDFSANKIYDESPGTIPIDQFRNDTDDTPAGLLNGVTSIIRFQLTDEFLRNGQKVKTLDMGQDSTLETSWKYSGQETPQIKDFKSGQGFAIDMIDPIILGKADYKITFFNGDTPLYQSVHESRSKFTGSFREQHNVIKLSNWEEENGESITYPARIPDPDAPEVSYPNKQVEINQTLRTNNTIAELTITDSKQGKINLLSTMNITATELFNEYDKIKLTYTPAHVWEGKGSYGSTKTIEIDVDKLLDGSVQTILNGNADSISGDAYCMRSEIITANYCQLKSYRVKDYITEMSNIITIQIVEGEIVISVTNNITNNKKVEGTCSPVLGPDPDTTIVDTETWYTQIKLSSIQIINND